MLKRKHEEHERQSLYGHGKKWVRGPLLGKGSSGSVYLAFLKEPKCRLLTHLPSEIAVKSAEVSDSGLLQKEGQVFNNLQGCQYIRQCFGEEITTGGSDEMVYNLLLEHGSGGTLADLIKNSGDGGLPESDVRNYTWYILLGLNYIHKRGYVHRDLRPENIILVPTMTPTVCTKYKAKIGDFESAKMVKNTKKVKFAPYNLRGTMKYLSPEAVVDNIQRPPSDIWALGCIVVEMLTGKSIWDGKQDWEVEDILYEIGKGHELARIPNEISEEGKDFLKGCLARNGEDRLTAKMLLNQPFVEGLDDDDDDEEEVGEVEDAEEVDSSLTLMFSENDNAETNSSSDDSEFYWKEDEEDLKLHES